MDRPRLIRGLRIAWSVVFGILCVLLIGLWVRSYVDAVTLTFGTRTGMGVKDGIVLLAHGPPGTRPFFTRMRILVLIAIGLSALPWIPLSKHYSLRTLLIATTLFAVVLGLVVWSIQ